MWHGLNCSTCSTDDPNPQPDSSPKSSFAQAHTSLDKALSQSSNYCPLFARQVNAPDCQRHAQDCNVRKRVAEQEPGEQGGARRHQVKQARNVDRVAVADQP